jgi:hypothetical protein
VRHKPAATAPRQSNVTNVRNEALRVLKAWPGNTWPPEARDTLLAALWCEPNGKSQQLIRELLQEG